MEFNEMIRTTEIRLNLTTFNNEETIVNSIEESLYDLFDRFVYSIKDENEELTKNNIKYWEILKNEELRVEIRINKELETLRVNNDNDEEPIQRAHQYTRLKQSLLRETNPTFTIYIAEKACTQDKFTKLYQEGETRNNILTTNEISIFKNCISNLESNYNNDNRDRITLKGWLRELEKILSIKLDLIPNEFENNLITLLNSDRMNLRFINYPKESEEK